MYTGADAMKRRWYYLLLLFVFLLGCLGHWGFKPKSAEEIPHTLTFKADNVNNLLLYALPREGDAVAIADARGYLSAVTHAPAPLYARKDGALLCQPSRLFSELTFAVTLSAHEKNGQLYLGERLLSLGEEITLCGENFALSARFTGLG